MQVRVCNTFLNTTIKNGSIAKQNKCISRNNTTYSRRDKVHINDC